ncbi:MAG TPA: SDR family NAD(P)-dependent oxidoreductase [Clostridium sp.]|uniref:dTDP-glucose 4,6-dehydratase n=1 Tax=Clostridium sp. TaxID=1506 RepID=UPI002F92528B
MNILVTGGAGFIGRWVVKRLLEDGHIITVLDNLSNSRLENIEEFEGNNSFRFVKGDIQSEKTLDKIFKEKFDIIFHLAASINVQDSIDNPRTTFFNDTVGTFNILEKAKVQMFGRNGYMDGEGWILDSKENTHPCKVVFMSTCMVYDAANDEGIDENHPTKPISPYGGSKIAAENMVLSYYNAYKLPTVVIRPFNTYGPFQKSGGEGGVVAIFIKNSLNDSGIKIYGSGEQTRDLLYVKDCATFVVMVGYNNKVNGEVVNAGTGRDVTINELAIIIAKDRVLIKHIKHIHPQSEIMKLKCNYTKAKNIVGWGPQYDLEEGIRETEEWIRNTKII